MWTPPYLDAPGWASLTCEQGRWHSGQVLSYVRPLSAALCRPRARMVFVELRRADAGLSALETPEDARCT